MYVVPGNAACQIAQSTNSHRLRHAIKLSTAYISAIRCTLALINYGLPRGFSPLHQSRLAVNGMGRIPGELDSLSSQRWQDGGVRCLVYKSWLKLSRHFRVFNIGNARVSPDI